MTPAELDNEGHDADDENVPTAFRADRPFLTENGAVTSEAVEQFTLESCWYLAWVLHQMTEWPIVAVTDDDAHAPDQLAWLHVAVETPDGDLLDVQGIHGSDDFLHEWSLTSDWPPDAKLTPVPADQFNTLLGLDPSISPDDFTHATRNLATTLLTQNGWTTTTT